MIDRIKRAFLYGMLAVFPLFGITEVRAQSQEIQQLLLNVEKLSQLKNILQDMKKGYDVLTGGYNAVRDIARGNFSIHDVFLDGLMQVSPAIKKYHRVADIIALQKNIMDDYGRAKRLFRSSGNFSVNEIDYMLSVYGNITSRSLRNIEELLMVITASNLRMSDDERLSYIDNLYTKTQEMSAFVRYFNDEARMLGLMRENEKREVQGLETMWRTRK